MDAQGSTPISTLILDYGDVLTWPQDTEMVTAMAARVGADIEVFREAFRHCRDAYDAGMIDAKWYWRQVLHRLGAADIGTADTIEWLIQSDVDSYTRYREEMWGVARAFKTEIGRTAMLSNCTREILARIRRDRAPEECFDVVVASCEVGCVKPAARIYETCLSRLHVAPQEALFVDDRADNLATAARLGMHTFHFNGVDSVRRLGERLRECARRPDPEGC